MYLLHGENSYLSWQELIKLKEEITKKEKDFEYLNVFLVCLKR